jgi:hypothetical protein
MAQKRGLLEWLLWLGGAGGLAVGIFVACNALPAETAERATETVVDTDRGGTPPSPPDVARRIVAGERAGEFVRILEEMATAGSGPTLARLTGSGLADPAVAFYAAPGGREPRLTFAGGTFARPLTAAEVAGAAKTKLDAEFGTTPHTFDGQSRTFDPGPLGGEVRCTTLTARAAARKLAMCGWVDRWTLGYVVDSSRTGSEAELARLLVTMRKDLELTG